MCDDLDAGLKAGLDERKLVSYVTAQMKVSLFWKETQERKESQ